MTLMGEVTKLSELAASIDHSLTASDADALWDIVDNLQELAKDLDRRLADLHDLWKDSNSD